MHYTAYQSGSFRHRAWTRRCINQKMNRGGLKRKMKEELTDKDRMEEPSPHKKQVTLTDNEKKHSKPNKAQAVSEVSPNYATFIPPTPILSTYLQEPLTSSTSSQNVNLSGSSLLLNDVSYQEQSDAMDPRMFLEIHQEYEKMLRQIPSSRIFTPERMRDLIPFDHFFTTTMRTIQISRGYRNESLMRNRPATRDTIPVRLINTPMTIDCSECMRFQKKPQSPPH